MPSEAEVGDRIAVFLGVIVPFVIRQRSEKEVDHLVVGECYVHGLMEGEALDLPNVKIEDITLV